jgi:hypothetical protein
MKARIRCVGVEFTFDIACGRCGDDDPSIERRRAIDSKLQWLCDDCFGEVARFSVEWWDALTDTERRAWYLKHGAPPHWAVTADPYRRRSPSL